MEPSLGPFVAQHSATEDFASLLEERPESFEENRWEYYRTRPGELARPLDIPLAFQPLDIPLATLRAVVPSPAHNTSLPAPRLTMSVPTPVQRDTASATFQQLARDFKFSEHIADALIAKKLETLRDFRFAFANEDEVKPFVERIRSIDEEDKQMEISRVRQAWEGVKDWLNLQTKDKAQFSQGDIEEMLPSEELSLIHI